MMAWKVAIFSQGRDRLAALQRRVESTVSAQLVLLHPSLPASSADPILLQLREVSTQIAIVEIPPEAPHAGVGERFGLVAPDAVEGAAVEPDEDGPLAHVQPLSLHGKEDLVHSEGRKALHATMIACSRPGRQGGWWLPRRGADPTIGDGAPPRGEAR